MPHPILRVLDELGWTQAELARRSKLSPQYVNDLIRGRSVPGRAGALALVCATSGKLTLEELLTREPLSERAP
jgi:transcriptional regulator with XRE-family HTH domain